MKLKSDFTPMQSKCPMLGVPGDTGKYYLYPFGGNVCYACPAGVWKYGSVSEDRQQEHCLSGSHHNCPRYQKCIAGEPEALKPSTWFQRAIAQWRAHADNSARAFPAGSGLLFLEQGKSE